MGDTKVKLTYFGKKRPKVVELEINKKVEKYSFEPFATTEVSEETAKILLRNAPDIFKRVDKDERKPVEKTVPKTDGYVGAVHAAEVPDLKKQQELDAKEEEGKDIDQIIDEASKKKEEAKEITAQNKNKTKGRGKAK